MHVDPSDPPATLSGRCYFLTTDDQRRGIVG